jgi:hypothetical protein
MKNTEERSTLELGKILSNYFRLTPDKYAREHFQNHLQGSSNSFDPQVAWSWLRLRLQQDTALIKDLDGNDNEPDPTFDWMDFEIEPECISIAEMFATAIPGDFLDAVSPGDLLLPVS